MLIRADYSMILLSQNRFIVSRNGFKYLDITVLDAIGFGRNSTIVVTLQYNQY